MIVCMPGFKPNHGYSYGFLFNCTMVGQASDSMTAMMHTLIVGLVPDAYL